MNPLGSPWHDRIPLRDYLKKVLSGPYGEWAKMAYDFIPPSLRYGRAYTDALALLQQSDRWGKDELVDFQERLLRKLLRHCYQNVPYYREIFEQSRLKPEDFTTIGDLQKLPLLTKEIVRQRNEDLCATNYPRSQRLSVRTSGSTGSPLHFYIDGPTRAMERALALRHLLWLGYKKGDIVAEIRAATFVDPKRCYRYYPASGQLIFDFTNLDDAKLDSIVSTLHKYRPRFLRAYPGSIYILARWMERHGKTPPAIKYVVTSSENILPQLKDQVERVLKAPIIDYYGQNEEVACAFQCSQGKAYHIQMEMGVLELIPAGQGFYEIVGTCLHNFAMPFVRYRTGDLAVPCDQPCSCGRPRPSLSAITGRAVDVIVTPELQAIAPGHFDFPFYELEEIKEAQIVQEDIRTLIVNVIPWDRLSDKTKDLLIRDLRKYVKSPAMKIIVEEVEDIPGTDSGKKRFVVSKLKLDDYIPGL